MLENKRRSGLNPKNPDSGVFLMALQRLINITRSALFAALIATGPAAAQSCRAITSVGQQPYSAEQYPFPLSLRANLIFLMKEEMAAIGEYDASLSSAVFTTLLEIQIKRAQGSLGHDVTGCITWELIQAYDSRGRTLPFEVLE